MISKGVVLDMALLFGTPNQKKEFCSSLLYHLKSQGWVKIQNYGISSEVIHKLFSMTKSFFNLPYEEKMKAKHPPQANPNRGYSYVGQENVAQISGYEKGEGPGKSRDIKETFDKGAANDSLIDNQWIPEESLPGFREFMESFYEQAFKAEMHLLSALAIALGISENHVKSLHDRAENEFRLLHYPALPVSYLADKTATRIAEHTDFGTITMLFQDSTGGLQVEDQTQLGAFRDIEPSAPTDLILNIGDSLQRLTNDTLLAACHRVIYPPTTKKDGNEVIPDRYSIAYFVKPNRSASLLPLKEFVSEETPCKYDNITAWEWNDLRIAKLYT